VGSRGGPSDPAKTFSYQQVEEKDRGKGQVTPEKEGERTGILEAVFCPDKPGVPEQDKTDGKQDDRPGHNPPVFATTKCKANERKKNSGKVFPCAGCYRFFKNALERQ